MAADDRIKKLAPRPAPPASDAPPVAASAGGRPTPLRVRRYEELDGPVGGSTAFRPHRYRPDELHPVEPSVELRLGEARHRCRPVDVSQNGVAFGVPPAVALAIDDTVEVAVRFDGLTGYDGGARVRSLRDDDAGRVVGVALLDGLVDVDDVIELRDMRKWTGAGSRTLGVAGRAWHTPTPSNDRFKSLVAELRLFLDDASLELADLEASLPRHVVAGAGPPGATGAPSAGPGPGGGSAARVALIERLRHELVPEVVRYSEDIDATLRLAAPDEVSALKAFSLRQVQPYLLQAPWMQRALYKPLGYPGDFEVMRAVYDRSFEGQTLFARAIGLAFVETLGAAAVRCRKDLMKRQLRRVIEEHSDGTHPVRILSIASGPAREVTELLAEIDELPGPLEIVLFDQDQRALAFAYGNLRPALRAWQGRVDVQFRHDSIRRLLRDPTIFVGDGGYDAIFSCGLFDYLEVLSAVRLARNLYANLVPGGSLYVANMVPSNPSRWFMEQHLDWHLIYRTRAELLDIGRRAAPDADVTLLEEETGVNPFVEITRR